MTPSANVPECDPRARRAWAFQSLLIDINVYICFVCADITRDPSGWYIGEHDGDVHFACPEHKGKLDYALPVPRKVVKAQKGGRT